MRSISRSSAAYPLRLLAVLVTLLLAALLIAVSRPSASARVAAPARPAAAPASAAGTCSAPFTWVARPGHTDRNGTWISGVGTRIYSVGLVSYLRRCGGWIYARHQIYVDTSTFPYGHKFMLQVSSRRSDGRWARAHRGAWLTFSGEQKIQEILLYQRRGTGGVHGRLRLTDVQVKHCACGAMDSGALPISSTLKGHYERYYGPEASPGH